MTTVDLIFRNGIDWKAFVLSLNAVQAKNEGTELSLQSIANKGDGVVVARLNVSEDADKEKIHSEFMEIYELKLKAVEETYKAKLNAKDEQIAIYRQQNSDMKEIVSLLANRPINVEVKAIADSKTMNENRKTDIGSINLGDGATLGSVTGDNPGTVTGNQTITKSESRQTLSEAATEIQKLLKQLAETNPTATVADQQAFLNAAISPTNKQRFVKALQAGGKELFKELMDNMYINVAVAAMEGWQSGE